MNTMLRPQTQTQQVILIDFINSLLAEGYISDAKILTHEHMLREYAQKYPDILNPFMVDYQQHHSFVILLNQSLDEGLIIPVKKAIKQPWQMQDHVFYFKKDSQNIVLTSISPLKTFDVLQSLGIFEKCDRQKLQQFAQDLAQSIEQFKLSQNCSISYQFCPEQRPSDLFLQFEQYAALRDRPYHPLAKLKDGFSDPEYQNFSPEFQQKIEVCWVAIKKDKLVYGKDILDRDTQQPARIFLNGSQFDTLQMELEHKNLDSSYMALPVHAWQFEHVLHRYFKEEIITHAIVPLEFRSDDFYASSSLRSLVYQKHSQDHLKLPLAVKSLGSLRYLPIVKMINGQKNQQLLEQAKIHDAVLAQRLWLCNENQWWGYLSDQPDLLHPDNLTLFDERPMHLAAQRRQVPAELMDSPYQVIPMASLGQLTHNNLSVFDLIMKWQYADTTPERIRKVFFNLCHDFFEVNLRLFRMGLMGEIHGQNICVVLKAGHFSGFLLRDHDSVRIHLPWMQQTGLSDPKYLSPHDFRITLYHDTVDELMTYLQTLGIQVNLASILESIASYYHLSESELWTVLAQALKQALDHVPFSDQVRKQLHDLLFEQEEWPYKKLIHPLLEQNNRIGSMPSSFGRICNPLKRALQIQ